MMVVFGLVTFWGTLLDKTTNQPLTMVHVSAAGPSSARSETNSRGKFTLSKLKPGRYTITVQSKDVPQQSFDFSITRNSTRAIKACSTTLDYRCGSPQAGGSSG